MSASRSDLLEVRIKRKDQRVSCLAKDLPSFCWNDLAPVVQRVDSAIHWINHYPAGKGPIVYYVPGRAGSGGF